MNNNDLQSLIDSIKGKPLVDVQQILNDAPCSFRIVTQDDVHYMVTDDIRLDRLNLELKEGIVVSAYIG
jgi:hypothetical protein